jgi:ATP/maltotriose-dependent transcriptional regulator MalT
MKRKQHDNHNQSGSLASATLESFWEYIPQSLFEAYPQISLLMEEMSISIHSAHSLLKKTAARRITASSNMLAGCETCQQFNALSLLHVIHQMERDPNFAWLISELARHSMREETFALPANCRHHLASSKSGDLPESLTRRELEVLNLIATRHSYSEIAEMLFISPLTLKTHVHHIFQKLGVNRRRFAIQRAHELGLVQAG